MRETWVRSLGREDPLEKEMATHSGTLAWEIPWMEKPSRLQSMRSQRVGHDWASSLSLSVIDKWFRSALVQKVQAVQTVVTRFKMKHKVAYCLHFTSKCKDWYLHPIGLFADRWATVDKMIVCISWCTLVFLLFYLSTPTYSFIEYIFMIPEEKKRRQMRKPLEEKCPRQRRL